MNRGRRGPVAAAALLVAGGLLPADPARAAAPGHAVNGDFVVLSATVHGNRVDLNWTNPNDPTWVRTVIRGNPGPAAPFFESDGTAVYTGRGESATYSPVVVGQAYSFSMFVEHIDGSYEYGRAILDGVTMNLTISQTQCPYGVNLSLGVTMWDPDDGYYMRGAHVSLVGRDSAGKAVWSRGPHTANTDGQAGFVGSSKKTLIYQATFPGDPNHNAGASNRVICTITAAVSGRATPAGVHRGKPETFAFAIAPVAKGITVRLQRHDPGGWVTVATTRTDAQGKGKLLARPTKKGTFKYRVRTPAYKSVIAGSSATYTIKVS